MIGGRARSCGNDSFGGTPTRRASAPAQSIGRAGPHRLLGPVEASAVFDLAWTGGGTLWAAPTRGKVAVIASIDSAAVAGLSR
ncbi:hypothetical protein SAOR_12115 [Salinisphaera orenii MK-B5]|uniref:Uncharacterized protein n=1 Tax=Salinisphaera orenii MK-B5 TaxID=856730 RepID=A0A423PIQ8_9GAMM|nr:hypothetical protein SAOR_12115 [Salinisphaera orenii MK-B5]